jgi:hypothetical protein
VEELQRELKELKSKVAAKDSNVRGHGAIDVIIGDSAKDSAKSSGGRDRGLSLMRIRSLGDQVESVESGGEGLQTEIIGALCDLASAGKVNATRALLEKAIEKGVDWTGGDYDLRTALHLAASEGHLPVVQLLVMALEERAQNESEKENSINPKDRWGGTPLDDAIRESRTQVAEFLRDRGGKQGNTASAAMMEIVQVDSTKTQESMSGLVDSADEHVLRLSLFIAADQPNAKRRSVVRKFSPTDRSSWTWENLQKLPVQQLAELECHAGHDYESLVGSPLTILNLNESNASNLKPFSKNLFPTDKFELTHSKGIQVSFQLSAKVFKSGTDANSAEALQVLERTLFATHKDFLYYELWSSPLSAITLPDAARKAASIPSSGRFYSFCYPVPSKPSTQHSAQDWHPDRWSDQSTWFHTMQKEWEARKEADDMSSDVINPFDPFVQWLANGAFVYYDHQFDIVAINALCLKETKVVEDALVNEMSRSEMVDPLLPASSSGKLKGLTAGVTWKDSTAGAAPISVRAHNKPKRAFILLTRPCKLPLSAIEPIANYGRWHPLTAIKALEGFTHFAWITPSEFLGDSIFTVSGGFAYLHAGDYLEVEKFRGVPISTSSEITLTKRQASRFYPVTSRIAELEHPTTFYTDVSDGSKRALRVHKYTELSTEYIENGKMNEAIEIVKKYKKLVLSIAPKPQVYSSAMHIQSLAAVNQERRHGVSVDKFVVDCKHVIFAAGQQSARGLAQVLGFQNGSDIEIHQHRSKLMEKCGQQIALHRADFEKYPQDEQPGLKKLYAEYASLTPDTIQQLVRNGACWLRPGKADGSRNSAAVWRTTAQGESAEDYLKEINFYVSYILFEKARVEEVSCNRGKPEPSRFVQRQTLPWTPSLGLASHNRVGCALEASLLYSSH